MKLRTRNSILRSTFTAMFAAIICLGTFISIPLPGGVPITTQNLFAILSALVLGGLHGAGSVGIFIIIGALGVPVFSGVTGGFAILAGPRGGFLWGFFLGAIVSGLIVGTPHVQEKKFSAKMWIRITIASLIGFAVIYLPGIPWYMHEMAGQGKSLTVSAALKLVLVPFIPGDFIKFVISVPLAAVLRPVAARYLYPADQQEEEEMLESLLGKNSK